MTLDDAQARTFAERLSSAGRTGEPVPLATDTFPTLDWSDARRIALARDDLRHAEGDVCIGYKLGWTSAAMREALGIDRPNWGTLWASQRCGPELDVSKFRHAKAEPEIVYVAGRDLGGADITAAEVIEYARGWTIGIEVVHPSWASFDFTWLDNTADNSSAAAVAIGAVSELAIAPSSVEVTFSCGEESRSGRGNQAMGDPAEAVAWLVRELAVEGGGIAEGQIVFTGGLTAPFDVTAGSRLAATSADLGTVEIAPSTAPLDLDRAAAAERVGDEGAER